MADETTGTVLRGADGSVYFIREEILDACKVTEPDMAEFCESLLGDTEDVAGFAMSFGLASSSVAVRGPFQAMGKGSPLRGLGGNASSTIMCPSFFSAEQFEVINPA